MLQVTASERLDAVWLSLSHMRGLFTAQASCTHGADTCCTTAPHRSPSWKLAKPLFLPSYTQWSPRLNLDTTEIHPRASGPSVTA